VCRRKRGRGLHVRLEIPELAQRDAGDIDDVGAERDGDMGVVAIGKLGAEGLSEAREVLVEGEKTQELSRRLAVGDGLAERHLGTLLVGRHRLGVQVTNLEEVQRDAPPVSPPGPLRIQPPSLLVCVEVDRVVQDLQVIRLSPFFRVAKLLAGVGNDPSSCAKESSEASIIATLAFTRTQS